jgi:hypothetical protein
MNLKVAKVNDLIRDIEFTPGQSIGFILFKAGIMLDGMQIRSGSSSISDLYMPKTSGEVFAIVPKK